MIVLNLVDQPEANTKQQNNLQNMLYLDAFGPIVPTWKPFYHV